MTSKSFEEFVDLLASKTPVPGGGGASAMAGALAISLGSMVGNYTVGNKKYADVAEKINTQLQLATDIRTRLIELVNEDAKAFEPLSEAYAVSKDDPTRADLLEAATFNALKPPLEMVRVCGEAIDVIRQMQLYGSKMLISDAGCAGALAKAAMQCAAMNVFINTKALLDREGAKQIEQEVDLILDKYIPLTDTIVSEVMVSVRG